MDRSDASRMCRLFEGFEGAYGTHGATNKNDTKGGKLEIKKTARTVREPVTIELWEKHLSGEQPLGIIPIREDATCFWGCIDVDEYDLDLGETVRRVQDYKLPMVVCRSKSGGAHVFLFMSESVPAEQMRSKLKQVAASLGWGRHEIYPKQNQVLAEQGDLGSWLNMPYLGGDKTDRYAVKASTAAMTLREFLSHAEKCRVGPRQMAAAAVPSSGDISLDDGPPCLQHLAAMGFPEGTRNNGLFGLGVFCKKKFGSRWAETLEKYNTQYMRPPLPSDEVAALIKNLSKDDYQYKCNDQPCVSFCNSSLCRTRKFGIGGAREVPIISGLSKLDTDDPLWFLDIEEDRLELTTDQLQDYRQFHKVCMARLTKCYGLLKQDTWLKMLGELMENATIIEAPPDVGVLAQFLELLEDFLTSRHRGERVDDLWLGKPWQSVDEGRYYFRLRDLMQFLERNNFKHKDWGRNKVAQRINDIGGGKAFLNIDGRGLNTHWVPDTYSKRSTNLDLPASNVVPI